MAKLDDLPSLGVPPKKANHFSSNIEKSGNDEFDDFNFDEDHLGDSSHKFDNAEKLVKDFYKENKEGFKLEDPKKNKFNVDVKNMKGRLGLYGGNTFGDEVDDDIEEDIQTDRDEQAQIEGARIGVGLTESGGNNYGGGITVSQSLGVDPSVDSLALDEYDHIEII